MSENHPHLVLLHAFPLDVRMWESQLNILPARTVTPNLYELGDSLEMWARHILNSVTSDRLVVVGASMGGSCAIEMARQAPERISALVLVGAKAGHRPEPLLQNQYRTTLKSQGIEGLWPLIQSELIGPQAKKEVVEKIHSLAKSQTTEDLIRAVDVFHTRSDLTDVVMNWRKPLLAIGGDQGNLENESRTNHLAGLAPQGKAHTLVGCGHYMNLEQPEKFNRLLRQVIEEIIHE